MMLTANWRHEIKKLWGIHTLGPNRRAVGKALWVTRCSKTKKNVRRGKPNEFYVSPINRYFCRRMEEAGLQYGVLSDKYGLHMCDEELDYYDIHPKELSEFDRQALGVLIREKALALGFGTLIFYNPTPLMSIPYFEMLHYSGLEVFYTTSLSL